MFRINAEVNRALAAPELLQRFAELSLSATPGTPETLNEFIKSEVVRWNNVIARAGIKLDE